MKRIIILLAVLILSVQNTGAAQYLPYTEPAPETKIQNTVVMTNYRNEKTVRTDAIFCSGRLCLPLEEAVSYMGGEYKKANNVYSITIDKKRTFIGLSCGKVPEIVINNGKEYISLYKLTDYFGYSVSIDITKNRIDILRSRCTSTPVSKSTGGKRACIRLEDIMADGMDSAVEPKYDASMLEKLRLTAQYLWERGQEYYIAWIPVYANPSHQYWNDLSRDFNLYNAYFLYVLDYMTEHGGHIGLHGYTHQYGNIISGDGWEWGKNTPYGLADQQKRMILAKQTAVKLGYNAEFFEFPHYGATDAQLLMAEQYFDAIYQSFPRNDVKDIITYTMRSGKTVYYIPTPAGYVRNTEDKNIFERISDTHRKGLEMSLYYHPVLDKNYISVNTQGNERVWYYSPNGMLPQIVDRVTGLGYSFTTFK